MAPVPNLATIALVASVLLTITFLIRRYLQLRHIPGPFLASITDLWLAHKYRNDVEYFSFMKEVHGKYGPVVRLGPTRVSFASPHSIPVIYNTKQTFLKADSYDATRVLADGHEMLTLLNCRDEKRAGAVKRHVSAGFSQAGFLKKEAEIDEILVQLLNRIGQAESDDSVHISTMLSWWSFDTINRIAFSDSLGYMAAGADVSQVFKGARERSWHWKQWYSLPTLEKWIYRNPWLPTKRSSKNPLVEIATRRVRERENDDEKQLEVDLLGRYLAASRKDPDVISRQDVISLTFTTINAGSESTATTLTLLLANLLKNPETLARLEEELLPLALPVPPRFEQVAALPYLDAAIRESMRVESTGTGSPEREVPREGATICGVWVPAGTNVSVSTHHSFKSTEIYGQDSDVFRPERWIECDKGTYHAMDKHHMGFSQGRRMCTGKHLAIIVLKKALASLITRWKISLAEEPKLEWLRNTREVDLKVRIQRRQSSHESCNMSQ